MPITYTPKSENQLMIEKEERIKASMLAEGDANFTISSAEDAVSQSGNPMIVLSLKVWDCNNKEGVVKDFLLGSMEFKVRHLCEALDLESIYETGKLEAHHLAGKSGVCILKMDKGNGKYGPQIRVIDYKKFDPNLPKFEAKKEPEPFFDDDIQF